MSDTALVAAGVVVAVVVVALVMGRRLKRLRLWLFKSGFEAQADQARDGARADEAEAGRDLDVENVGEGGASANRSKAGRDLRVRNTRKK